MPSTWQQHPSPEFSPEFWGRGAIGYADGVPSSIPGAAELMNMGKIVVELDRVSDKAISRVIGHAYLGMSVISDKRGVVFKSDV